MIAQRPVRKLSLTLAALLMAAGCASTPAVDMEEAARLLGRERDVRIDAQLFGHQFGRGARIGITWQVENMRPEPIGIAELVPEVSYDPQTLTITIALGSEVPGNEFIPKINRIGSGEIRVFQTSANLSIPVARSRLESSPRYLRIRLNFLEDLGPFGQFVEIDEAAVHAPGLADELFIPWVENNRIVLTNEIPITWDRR